MLQKAIALALLFCLPFQTKVLIDNYEGHKHWKEAYQLYQYQIYDDAADEYLKAAANLPRNGLLLQMYGKCLAMDEQWKQAKIILEKAKILRSDPILASTLGDTYKALKQYDKAETAYWQVWYMVPHKFYPKYLLAKLYNETGQTQKAVDMANDILSRKIKIPSKAIDEIKKEMGEIVNSNQ